jgi:hypothetical protein
MVMLVALRRPHSSQTSRSTAIVFHCHFMSIFSANPAHSPLDDRVVLERLYEDDCLITALVCRDFRDFVHAIHRERNIKGITTSVAGVVSSLERLLWVRSSFPGEKAPWLNHWNRGIRGTCYHIARHGPLEVLQWAREHGCEWDEDTCMMAARGGQLDVQQHFSGISAAFRDI